MTLGQFRSALAATARDIDRNHLLVLAAGLSYYFVLSLFPALILAAALLAYLPIPNLFNQGLDLMSRFVPPDSMGLVRRILGDVVTPGRGAFLSLGLAGTLWVMSSGITAVMDALNVAYGVPETRPMWKTRLKALGLAFLVGSLMTGALAVMIVGPQFGNWLAAKVGVSWAFAAVWPVLRWTIAIAFAVLGIELLYFLAPNVRQRFACTLPGALVAVTCWLTLSYLLGIYFQSFANYNKTYGALGGAVALMVWLYWSGFAILMGAQLNSELLTACGAPALPLKELALKEAAAENAGADLAA